MHHPPLSVGSQFRKRLLAGFVTVIALLGEPAANRSLADQPKKFPAELTQFRAMSSKPIFAARGVGHWDVKIRERGWIMREADGYKMWYTGYDGTREGVKLLGFATSVDGLTWKRRNEPIYRDHWVEDMMVVKHDGTYYMFAEGRGDQGQLLTSPDGIQWKRQGRLDIRLKNGRPIPPGPYGTPTAYFDTERKTWLLFYERRDAGVWLASSKDMKVWTNVQDEPVLKPGPQAADRLMIALNQVIKHQGRYYAYYHGTGSPAKPRLWATCLATSTDLIHWEKYPKNPLQPRKANKSSGILISDGKSFRLYTMHDRVDVHLPIKTKE